VIVLDACVVIAHLESTDVHHRRATELLMATADQQLAVSVITMAEILVGPARAGQLERVRGALQQLDLVTVPFSDDAPARLANLRATSGLRLPDCCVLLAAETAQGAVGTFDARLAKAADDRGLTVLQG